MAYDIGIKVGIDGDAKLKNQLKSINQETRNYKSALKELDTEFVTNGTKQDQLARRTELLTNKMDAQRNKVALLRAKLDELQAAEKKDADSINYYAEQYNRAQAELNETERELKELQSQLVQTGKGMETFGNKMVAAGDKMTGVGRTLSTTVTLPIVALGAAAVKAEMDFSASMSKVEALSGATTAQMEMLRQKALDVASTSKFTGKEVADAFGYMALAGWKTNEMLVGITAVTDLAAASGEDLAQVSDIVTDDLTAFGLAAEDAGHFADILAQTTANSNTNVQQMGEAFKYAAPLAGAMGYSVEDVATALGIMANNGIKASTAGVTLRSLFTRMAAPTKEVADAMNRLGIELTDTDGKMRPLMDILNDLRSGFTGLSEAEQAATAKALGGQRAISGLLAIARSSDEDFQQLVGAIESADGAAGRMAKTMLDNTKGSLILMKSSLEGAAIAAGEALAPAVTSVANVIRDAAKAFSNLTRDEQKAIVKTLAVVAAIGPVVTIGGKVVKLVGNVSKVGGKLLTMIGKATIQTSAQAAATTADAAAKGADAAATATLTTAQKGLNAAMAASPLVIFVGALGAASVAAAALSQAFGVVSRETQKTVDEITDHVDTIRSDLEGLKTSFEDNTAAAEGQAKTASALIDRLEELGQKSERTAAEQQEMQDIVDMLNNSYPEMKVSIDKTTGALTKSTTEMRKYVEQAQRVARAAAYQQVQTEAYTAQARAEQEAAKAAREVKKAKQEQARAEQEVADFIARGVDKTKDAETATRQYNSELTALKQRATDAGADVRALERAEAKAKQAVVEAGEAVEIATNGLRLNSAATAEAANAHRLLAAAEHQGAQGASVAVEGWNTLSAAEKASAEEMVAAYERVTGAVQSAVENQMGFFEQFNGGMETTAKQMRENLESQVQGVENWEQNLVALSGKVSDEMLAYLAELGPQGAAYVQALVDDGGDELAKINELWPQAMQIQSFENEAATQLKGAIGELTAGGSEELVKLAETLGVQAKGTGNAVPEGLAQGIVEKLNEVHAAAEEAAKEVENTTNGELEVNSPSRKMAQTGRFVSMGLAQGITQGKQQISVAARAAGQVAGQVGTTAQGYVNTAYNAGYNVSIGLARGIMAGKSNITDSARTVAQAAIDSAKAKLQISSPSKVFYEIGAYTVEGFANALEDGQNLINRRFLETFTPAAAYPGVVSGSTTNIGGMTFNVYAQEGQDVNAIARAVSNQVARELTRRAVG